MPRFTEEQRKTLIAELMKENDDDDDDDLLKPSLIHPSNRSTSSPLIKENNEKKEEVNVKLFTEQELKEQALKSAQTAIERDLSLKCFPTIAEAADLKWYRSGPKVWPVFINKDPSNKEIVKIKFGKLIIEHIGNRVLYKATIQPVFARNLQDYHNGDEASWNSVQMALYLKQLKRRTPFTDKKGQEQQRMILEEEVFLDLLLKKQLQIDKEKSERNHDDDDEEEEEEEAETFKYTASEDTITVAPPSPPNVAHAILTESEMNAQCRRLRAGDVIEYIHPVLNQRQTAMILKAMPPDASRRNQNDTVLSLSDGFVLPRESEVRLVQRYLRGHLVENTGAATMFLWDFKLDASQNGNFQESHFNENGGGKSMGDQIRDAYDEANEQVEQEVMKLANNRDADNVEEVNEHQVQKKRPRTESNTSTSPATGRRKSSRRTLPA